jgi:tetratricopeptide (TPR) repeat protein
MKKAACEKLAKALLPYLPGYIYDKKPNAIFQVPVGKVFRGMIFDSSGFSAAAFYPDVFSQPLYVPSDGFTLTFGKRLLGNWEYEPGQENLLAKRLLESMEREGAFKLLEDLSSADKMAVNLIRYHSNPNDPYLQQAIGYSFAVCGRFDEALRWLDKCRETLEEMQRRDPSIKWHGLVLDEVSKFRELVATNPEAAKKQLDEWTEYTRSHLGLPA